MKDMLSVSLICVWAGPSEMAHSPCALEKALAAAQELLSAGQLQRGTDGVGVHSPPQAQLGHTTASQSITHGLSFSRVKSVYLSPLIFFHFPG